MSLRAKTSPHQYGGSVLVTGPASEPVSAAQLQAHLRVTSTILSDAAADQLITEARTIIEETTGLAMIAQSWKLALDAWPVGGDVWWDGTRQGATTELQAGTQGLVEFPRYPLASVTSVTTFDSDGSSTAITVATVFDLDTYQTPGRMTLASGQTWPTLGQALNAVEIVYVAGYSELPAPLYRAVLNCAAYLYNHRGDGCDVMEAYKQSGAESLAGLYSVKRI